MKKYALCVLLLFFFIITLNALDLGTTLITDYYGLIDPTTFYNTERIRITATSEISDNYGFISFFLGGVAYFQPIGDPMLIETEQIIRQAYIGFHFSIFDIYIGQKLITWGKVDVMSPLNVVNSTDTRPLSMDNFFEATIPEPMVDIAAYFTDELSLEIVYIPFLQPNIFDIENVDVYKVQTIPVPLDKDRKIIIDAAFVNREIPTFSEFAHSIHIAGNYISDLFDLLITYSFYLDHFLDFDLSDIKEEITEDADTITLSITGNAYPAYNRLHNIGIGICFYIEDFLISADASLKLTEDLKGTIMETKNPELFYTIQVEKLLFSKLRLQGNFFHRLILNYDAEEKQIFIDPTIQEQIGEILDDYMLQEPSSQLYFLIHFDINLFRETLNIGANIIYGYSENALFLAPRISYKINDYITISSGADLWWGGQIEGFLGMNEQKDNLFVRIKMSI